MSGKRMNGARLWRWSQAAKSVCWICRSRLHQLSIRKLSSPSLLGGFTSESQEPILSACLVNPEQNNSIFTAKLFDRDTPSRKLNTKPSSNSDVKHQRSGNVKKPISVKDGQGKGPALFRLIPFSLGPLIQMLPTSSSVRAHSMLKLDPNFSKLSGDEVILTRNDSKSEFVVYRWSSMVNTDVKGDVPDPSPNSVIWPDHERKMKGVLDQAHMATKKLARLRQDIPSAATSPGSSPSTGFYYTKGLLSTNLTVSRPQRYSTSATSRFSSTHEIPVSVKPPLFPGFPSEEKPVSVRKSLRTWQMQRDAEKESNISPAVDVARGAQELQHFLTRGYTNPEAGKPAHIDDEDDGILTQCKDEDHVVEINEPQPIVKPGDMVELTMNGERIMAIYVRSFLRQAQFYTVYGKWVHRFVRNLYFIVPEFVEASEVAGLLPFLPKEEVPPNQLDRSFPMGTGVPRSVGASLVEKMNEFIRSSDKVYRAHADRIDRAHSLTSDEVHLRYATLTEIASVVLQVPNKSQIAYPSLFAVDRALKQAEIGFRVDFRDHWRTQLFEILPQREVRLVLQVRQWLREHQEYHIGQATSHSIDGRHNSNQIRAQSTETQGVDIIRSFISKARDVITESRKHRPLIITASKHGIISTSSTQLVATSCFNGIGKTCTSNVILGHFADAEVSIIKFMELWVTRKYLRQGSALCAMGSMLLRATGLYEQCELSEHTGFNFLQELGVLAPWENRMAFNTRLALPGYSFDTVTEELQAEADRSLKSAVWSDSMAHLRKDWGDLEVFCVDSARALEIDDGFSLEAIDGDESQFWIHVHVANPTAFIAPEHPLSKYAARLVESIYFPEKPYLMLSPEFTQRHCSLQNDRPALTFSAKVDSTGNILDINIVPSTVRKVTFITPESLIAELAPDAAEFRPTSSLTVGFNPPPLPVNQLRAGSQPFLGRSKILNPFQKNALSKLLELGCARQRQREAKGAISSTFNKPDVSVHYLATTQPYRRTTRRIDGDPTVCYQMLDFDPVPDVTAQKANFVDSLVPNMMILACEVAATWTSERDIPVPYRGTWASPELGSALEYKKNVLDPLVEKHGFVPLSNIVNYLTLAGRGYASVDSVEHLILGTNGYTKVTSPLRRYGDMLTHWQIEAAIRREAETGQSLVGSTDHSFLPFSRSEVQQQIEHIFIRESSISAGKRASELHWILHALFRAFYLKQAVLPETFETFIMAQDMHFLDNFTGVTKYLALKAYMKQPRKSAGLGTMEVGDWWECKIADIDLYKATIQMTPVRLIKKADDSPQIDLGTPLSFRA